MLKRNKRLKDTKLRLKRDSKCGRKNSTNKRKNFKAILMLKFKQQEERSLKENNWLIKKTKDKDFWDFKKVASQMKKSRLNAMNFSVVLHLSSNLERETMLTIKLIKLSRRTTSECQLSKIQTTTICTSSVPINCLALSSKTTLLWESVAVLTN